MRDDKGYILVIAMIFTMVCLITGIGLYYSVFGTFKETGIKETGYIGGYFLDIAALRYAAVLLKDPQGNFGFLTASTSDGESAEKHVLTDYPALAADIGLSSPRDVIITVTERPSDGKYDVSAKYSY